MNPAESSYELHERLREQAETQRPARKTGAEMRYEHALHLLKKLTSAPSRESALVAVFEHETTLLEPLRALADKLSEQCEFLAKANRELSAEVARLQHQHETIQAQIVLPASVPRTYTEIAEENGLLRAKIATTSTP